MAAPEISAAAYARHAGFVPLLGAPLLDLLAARPGEAILDLGCGDGVLSQAIADTGAIVTGVDHAISMVDAARIRGINALVMDGQNLEFSNQFDAVFSNAALHWMPQYEAVIAGVWRALKPGGRFVGEMGGHGNIAAIVTALNAALGRRRLAMPLNWYFPPAEDYARALADAGFMVNQISLTPRPTELKSGMRGWLETFAEPFLGPSLLRHAGPGGLAALFKEVETLLAPSLRTKSGLWVADYVRLRFKATKPGLPAEEE